MKFKIFVLILSTSKLNIFFKISFFRAKNIHHVQTFYIENTNFLNYFIYSFQNIKTTYDKLLEKYNSQLLEDIYQLKKTFKNLKNKFPQMIIESSNDDCLLLIKLCPFCIPEKFLIRFQELSEELIRIFVYKKAETNKNHTLIDQEEQKQKYKNFIEEILIEKLFGEFINKLD